MGFEYWGFELDGDILPRRIRATGKKKAMSPLFEPQEI
jgi:hypothetical protein